MQKSHAVQICICAVLTVFAVLFQSAPVFLPMAGMLLSPLATFPIALAAHESKSLGAASYFAAGAILLFIFPEEALIFFLTTGIIGLSLGIYNRSFLKAIAATTGILFGGMNLLTYLAGISLFGDLTRNLPFWDSFAPYLLFSLGYAAAWVLLLRYIFRILEKRGILRKPGEDKSRGKKQA